jgi:aminopeptidase N
VRGALTLHALRLRVGDEVFFDILRTYVERNRNGNSTTADFVALAEEVSGEELSDLFNEWLYDPVIPDMPELGLSAPE